MKFKFKVGDSVKILDGSNCPNYTYGWYMHQAVGRTAKIKRTVSGAGLPAYQLDFGQLRSMKPGFSFINCTYDERYLELSSPCRLDPDDDYYGMERKHGI